MSGIGASSVWRGKYAKAGVRAISWPLGISGGDELQCLGQPAPARPAHRLHLDAGAAVAGEAEARKGLCRLLVHHLPEILDQRLGTAAAQQMTAHGEEAPRRNTLGQSPYSASRSAGRRSLTNGPW